MYSTVIKIGIPSYEGQTVLLKASRVICIPVSNCRLKEVTERRFDIIEKGDDCLFDDLIRLSDGNCRIRVM